MKILVIKQTSLGDVLHASGHIRAIKQQFPDSELVVQTALSSAEIYRHNPWIDQLLLIDRYGIKKNWFRRPVWALGEMIRAVKEIRQHEFDMAFDLQGLAKTALFLYLARSRQKFVKGNWPGIPGFRDKKLHAMKELDGVLELAGVQVKDSSMEFPTSQQDAEKIDQLLIRLNPDSQPVLILSPFSRWKSKDWPLQNYLEVAQAVASYYAVVFTGSNERAKDIDIGLQKTEASGIINLAGKLSLPEFVEVVGRSAIMLTGDSFPMHVACARKIPVIALFGPTDEKKVGPIGKNHQIVRVPGCDICDRKNCPKRCLERLDSGQVIDRLIRASAAG